MKFTRVKAMAKKEFLHILRDWRALSLSIVVPIILLSLFGYALTLDVDHVPMGVWDQNSTPLTRDFISKFSASRYFDIHYFQNYKEIERGIDEREILAALILPEDFTRNMEKKVETRAQFIVDGSDSNTATLTIGYAEAIIRAYQKSKSHLTLVPRVWYNPDLISQNNIVPSLIAVIMMVISALLTSLTIAREWERGTMEQLISTPVKVNEIILGKLIPYFVICMVDVLLIVLMGEFIFQVPMRGSYILLFFTSVIFMISALSIGLFISIITKNQLLASQFAMVSTFLPSFLLSGFLTSLSNLPEPIQWISYFVPARYFISLLKDLYLKGAGLALLWDEIAMLILFAFVLSFLSWKNFKKKLI